MNHLGPDGTPGPGAADRTAERPALTTHPAALAGPSVDWSAVRRVLVVRLDNLGDVVLTGPLLRAVRAAIPAEARLDLLASPGGAAVAPLLSGVDSVITWRASWQDASGTLPQDPDRELELVDRMRGYDAVLVSTSFSQSPWPVAYAAYLAGVPIRIGQSQEFGGSLLTHWVLPAADDETAHQVDRSLRLAAAAGITSQGSRLALLSPPPNDPLPAEVLAPYDVLLAPGASAPSRRYRDFRTVTDRLRAEGLRVLVVGTAKETDLVDEVSGGVDALAGRLDVVALAATVRGARLVITNNSGCMHLADAYGVPSVVLFAGTESLGQYAPRGGVATVLQRSVSCSPCRSFSCPYAQECLDVPVEEVVSAALARLDVRAAVGSSARASAVRSGARTRKVAA